MKNVFLGNKSKNAFIEKNPCTLMMGASVKIILMTGAITARAFFEEKETIITAQRMKHFPQVINGTISMRTTPGNCFIETKEKSVIIAVFCQTAF